MISKLSYIFKLYSRVLSLSTSCSPVFLLLCFPSEFVNFWFVLSFCVTLILSLLLLVFVVCIVYTFVFWTWASNLTLCSFTVSLCVCLVCGYFCVNVSIGILRHFLSFVFVYLDNINEGNLKDFQVLNDKPWKSGDSRTDSAQPLWCISATQDWTMSID